MEKKLVKKKDLNNKRFLKKLSENHSGNKGFFKKLSENPALIVILVVVILTGALFGTYAYIYAGRKVYAYVKGTPIYNYEMSNEIVNQAEENNVNLNSIGTDPKGAFARYTLMSFAKRAVISRRLYYLMGIKDGFKCTKDDLDKALYDFKKNVIGNSNTPEKDFKNELEIRGINEEELKKILSEEIIANKEKDKLTKNITITPEEVKKYYKEWSYAYTNDGKENADKVFKEKYATIKSDALAMKKQDFLRKYTNNLIEKNKKYIQIDNRYKKFMRWVYRSLFNLSVPNQFKPGNV